MATATITVQELRQPAPGKKKGIIVDTNGDYYYVWPNDLAQYQQGGVYDVVFEASQFRNMTIRNINSSRPSSQPAAAPAPRAAPQSSANGAAAPTGQVVPAAAQTGAATTAGALQPIIAGTGAKPTEAFMKASKQLNDLQGALTDYKDELASDKTVFPTNIPVPFTDSGIPLPTGSDTARMSGKYNSLLMGVKNLYELGALTGPDMSIIERQFTNPASFTGALTSRKAMDEQVKVLEDMLSRAKENLSTSYRQTVPAAAAITEWVWQNGQLVKKK